MFKIFEHIYFRSDFGEVNFGKFCGRFLASNRHFVVEGESFFLHYTTCHFKGGVPALDLQ